MVSNFRSDGSGLNVTVVFFSWNKKSFAVFINRDRGLAKLFGLNIAPAPPSYPLLGKKGYFG